MPDIERTKQKTLAPGSTAPGTLQDPVAGQALAEVQAQLEELFHRLAGVTTSTTTEGTNFDDSELRRQIRLLWDEMKKLKRRVTELERKFPIVRPAIVVSDHTDYLVCGLYNAVTQEPLPGNLISVAKPYELRRTPFDGVTRDIHFGWETTYTYQSNYERTYSWFYGNFEEQIRPYYSEADLIDVVRVVTGLTDEDDAPIVWQDINTAGRSWTVDVDLPAPYTAANWTGLLGLTPTEAFAVGYTTDGEVGYWIGAITAWRNVTHFRDGT